jgi:subfamily B ATP-binding cassette protein MsbA
MRPKKVNVVKAMVGLVSAHKYVLLGVLACLVVLSCCNLAMPYVLKHVINSVFLPAGAAPAIDKPFLQRQLTYVLVAILVIYGMRNLLFYLSKTRVIEVGEQVAFELRQRLIRHLQTLSVDFYQQNKPGKISARVLQDVQAIKLFIQDELANMIINLLMLIVAVAIMLYIHWSLAVVTMTVLPCHVIVYCLFRRPITRYAREAKERIAAVSGDLIEQFDGVATVKASATQLIEQEKFRESMRKGMRAQIKQGRYYILQKVAADLLVGVGVIVLFGVGGYAVLHEAMQPGDFVAFYCYVGILYPRLLELVSQAGKFSRTGTSVERVFEMLRIEPDVREKPDALPHEIFAGKVEFRNVSFGYQNGSVLDGVSFTVEPGEHVLVTGPSGAGKSTCVNLIPRFHDPGGGAILIDGVDVRDFTLTSLRRQIGLVFQDCFLFNDTIMANIRYACPEASDESVIKAACQAYADEFIQKLPDGYMTMIGEGGIQLSQGEKRRLMIARAILKNPRILILDEPLVSLDLNARQRAVEGISPLIGNRTVMSITHYPGQLPHADKQLYVCDGKITVTDLSDSSQNA